MKASIMLAGAALVAFATAAQPQDRRPEYGPVVSVATAKKIAAPAISVTGSIGLTPKSCVISTRPSAAAPTTPSKTPMTASRMPCETNIRRTLCGLAPSAERIPISGVRWLTTYDNTA